MNNPRQDIEHWWAVEAMIASYNHVYKVTYKTEYETRGPIGVSIYDGAPIASVQYECLALNDDARSVMDAVLAYPMSTDRQYIIDVFHPHPSNPALMKSKAGISSVTLLLGISSPQRIRLRTECKYAAAAAYLRVGWILIEGVEKVELIYETFTSALEYFHYAPARSCQRDDK